MHPGLAGTATSVIEPNPRVNRLHLIGERFELAQNRRSLMLMAWLQASRALGRCRRCFARNHFPPLSCGTSCLRRDLIHRLQRLGGVHHRGAGAHIDGHRQGFGHRRARGPLLDRALGVVRDAG